MLRAIKGYKGGPVVRAALRLAPLLFQRPGELRGSSWAEIDLEAALWTIPAARMKRTKDGKENGQPHLVPLPTQAVQILEVLKPYTESTGLVFPGERQRSKPISENSVRTALISMGYTPDIQTWHGFRATARTMLAERLECDPLVIEAQLAHSVRDANGRAYTVSHGIDEDEQSNLLDLFESAMKSIATTLAREARFDMSDFATAKQRNCEGFQLTLQRLRIDGRIVWQGQFSRAEQQFTVTASLE